MTEPDRDEQLLIDFLSGRCDPATAEQVRGRLETDRDFSALHADISNALAALRVCPAPEPPEDLVDRTMARVRAIRRTESLLEAQAVGRESRRAVFTFRELAALAAMVVLAVGILIPSMRKAQRRAQRAFCADNIWAIHTALGHYANANEEAFPGVSAQGDSWLSRPGMSCASNSAGLFLLVRDRYAAPDVFQCPAAGGRPFVVEAHLSDFPSSQTIGYSYQHSLKRPIRRDDPGLVGVARNMVILADATPLFLNGKFRPEHVHRRVSENHRGAGQNVLYLDGHVVWTTHARVGVGGNNIWLAEGIYEYTGSEEPVSLTDTFLLPHPGQ